MGVKTKGFSYIVWDGIRPRKVIFLQLLDQSLMPCGESVFLILHPAVDSKMDGKSGRKVGEEA